MEIVYDSKTNLVTITFTPGKGVVSASGKSRIVATTNGFAPITGSNIRVSLNAIIPK